MSRYRISSRIKALETNFVCPLNFTDDYKSELKEKRNSKSNIKVVHPENIVDVFC